MKNELNIHEAPLSPVRQAWLMLVVIAPMAACYPAIKLGLDSAPPLRFGGLRTLIGGAALLLALLIRRKPLWSEARLARWILPLGLLATTLTFGAMFASSAYTGAGIASVLGNTKTLIIIVLAAAFLGVLLALNSSASAAVATVLVKRLRPGKDLMALILLAVTVSVFAGWSRAMNQGRQADHPTRHEQPTRP